MSKLAAAPTAYTFDDFMLAPVHSEIRSRKDPDLSTQLYGQTFGLPLVSSPMNTVTEEDMLVTMGLAGSIAVLHRYMPVEAQIQVLAKAITRLQNVGLSPDTLERHLYVSVGANGDSMERVARLYDSLGWQNFCIDVANGHSVSAVERTRAIRELYPTARIMAGNVVTLDGTYRLAEAGANSIRVGIGPGCFASGTRILMANGTYKNIENVRPRDRVINKNGQAVAVKNSWCTGRRKVMSYRHTLFYKPTVCTPDHKHFLRDISDKPKDYIKNHGGYCGAARKNKPNWKSIGEIQNAILTLPNNIEFDLNDSFAVELKKRTSGNDVHNFVYKVDSIIKPDYNSGYIFGTFLGDGNAHCTEYKNSKNGQINWVFGGHEAATAQKLKKSIQKTIGKTAKIDIKEKTILVSLYYKPLADYLNTFGKKDKKNLPSELLVNNKEYLMGIYDGLIDSDGHSSKNDEGFTNTSENLLELFGVLRYMLYGTFPNMYMKQKSVGKLNSCNVKNLKQGYRTQILKTANSRVYEQEQLIKILNIGCQSDSEVLVYDIEVDCPTHSFIANNVVVHNSMCTTRVVTGHGIPQLSAIEDCVNIKNQFEYNGKIMPGYPDVGIIADGGLRSSGDIVKALAIGADAVMLGSLLAGTSATPGEIHKDPETQQLYKYYHGMASEAGRSSWYDRSKTSFVPEGESTRIPYKGDTAKVIESLIGGVRSGMSYAGAGNLAELRENAQWRRITSSGQHEGTPHGKR